MISFLILIDMRKVDARQKESASFDTRRLFFRHETHCNLSLARAVELYKNNPLPFPEQRLTILYRHQQRCSNQCGKNVIRDVRWIVWMAIMKLGNDGIESIKQVEIRPRI
jgi:hypothetical protein